MPRNKNDVFNLESNHSVLRMVQSPSVASVASKMVRDPRASTNYDKDGNIKLDVPDANYLLEYSQGKIQDIKDAEIVKQLLPDIERAAMILCSSIVSPRDMNKTELQYNVSTDILPIGLASEFVNYVKKYCNENYNIERTLYDRIYRCLFVSGSYPVTVLPENSLDEVINRGEKISIESLEGILDKDTGDVLPVGILGKSDYQNTSNISSNRKNVFSAEQFSAKTVTLSDSEIFSPKSISLEGYSDLIPESYSSKNKKMTWEFGSSLSTGVSITDNTSILSLSSIDERMTRDAISGIYASKINSKSSNTANESFGTASVHSKDSDKSITEKMYKKLKNITEEIVTLKTSDQCTRYSAGEPFHHPWPSESIKPIIIPGNPTAPIGYLALIDEMGYPISKEVSETAYRDSTRLGAGAGLASQLLERASVMYNGACGADSGYDAKRKNDLAVKLYADIIEKDVISRFKNGVMGKMVEIPGINEFSRIMFARSLAHKGCRLLFIPSDLMVYTAFMYDDNGIGKSLLQDNMVLYLQRIHLMLAATRAGLANATPRKDVEIVYDEDDPDPEIAGEKVMHEYLNSRGFNYLSVGIRNLGQIEQLAQNMGVRFIHKNHPDLPNMEVNVQDTASQITPPDDAHLEELKKSTILTTGLSPETIDNSIESDFAQGIVRDNLLNQLVISRYQDTFIPFLEKEVRLLVSNSPEIYSFMREKLTDNINDVIITLLGEDMEDEDVDLTDAEKENVINRIIAKFIDSIELSLPSPNATEDEIKAEAFDKEFTQMENVIKQFFSEEAMPEKFGGEGSGETNEAVGKMMLAYHMRKWCVENDYKTEVFDWYEVNKEGDLTHSLIEELIKQALDSAKISTTIQERLKPITDSTDAVLTSQGIKQDDGFGGGGDSSWGSDDSSSSDSGGDDWGDDSGGDDFDMDMEADMSMDETTDESEETTDDTAEPDDGPVDGM